ncbi:MAG: nitroreductase family deazaflavin-dependent oxidoreductase [Chloroflexi bacterium]|nr:MAG: nitroreductase family deazaflavin-dependent oxidoreductase [Chloroflexota bacterium]
MEARLARVPAVVGVANGIVAKLARVGVPVGPNALLTVRGRKSGVLRTTPVAVIAVDGRRWVQCPFGEVNWVRNLRAVGEGTLTTGRRAEAIRATELSRDEAAMFFAEVLGPYIRRRRMGRTMAGVLGLRDVLEDPRGAAERHPVFELTAT